MMNSSSLMSYPTKLKKDSEVDKKNRIIYGSDATFDKGYGAFAWGILDKDNNNNTLVKYHSPLHGCSSQNHSTRGELFGLLGCLRHISYLYHKYKFPVQKKKFVCISTPTVQLAYQSSKEKNSSVLHRPSKTIMILKLKSAMHTGIYIQK